MPLWLWENTFYVDADIFTKIVWYTMKDLKDTWILENQETHFHDEHLE